MKRSRLLLCVCMLGCSLSAQTLRTPGRGSAKADRLESLLSWPQLLKRKLVSLAYTPDGSDLWYSITESDGIHTYSLDLDTGARRPALDNRRLRDSISAVLGKEPEARGVPFRRFSFVGNSQRRIRFTVENQDFILDLATYSVESAKPRPTQPPQASSPRVLRRGRFGRPDIVEVPSRDGLQYATLTGHNVAIRDTETGEVRKITADGDGLKNHWGYDGVSRKSWAWWSTNGRYLVIRKADFEGVESFPLIDWLETPPEVEWIRSVHNVREGNRLPREELYAWDTVSHVLTRLDTGEPEGTFLRVLAWRPSGSELIVLRITRDYRDLEVLALNPTTGKKRTLLEETYDTCFTTPLWSNFRSFWPLPDDSGFLWRSDHDGWQQLYLHDFDRKQVTQLTSGAGQVDDVVGIDIEGGWVYFRARRDPTRPYDMQIFRVRLDGSGLMQLTEGAGRFYAELTPDSKHLEIWRRHIDTPTELQIRKGDGTLVHRLQAVDISKLVETGWTPPEEFAVQAADGVTELWGVLYKPDNFNSALKYPVIEIIYGGPVLEYTPRTLLHWSFPRALAQLGYVVVILDARGTPGRGRKFLEIGWDQPSIVVADHAAALRQLASENPFLDLERVGILGSSWGGNFTSWALMLEPELYDVGVAVSGGWWGNPDLGAVKATVSEQCATLRRAEPKVPPLQSLRGHLLIVHGTGDVNLSGSADLMWWLNEVARAQKYVDLLLLPNRPHSLLHRNDPYVVRAIANYFEEHLGASPPLARASKAR